MQLLKTKYFETTYEQGSIRWIKSNGTEILRMIYSAVRDQNWGTLDPKILDEKIFQNENNFEVEVLIEYLKDTIHFRAKYKIKGEGKKLSFEMNGVAKSTFKTCRVGFCVLHPIKECIGKKCEVIHPDGISKLKFFPCQIEAHQPMMNISEMKWKPSDDIQANLIFEGDIFEMEDQRNWTDASYKTYCRPLSLPFPFEIKKGELVQQNIELEIQADFNSEVTETKPVLFKIDKSKGFRIPEIGVCKTNRKESLSNNEATILKELPFQHLRAEIKLFKKDWRIDFNKAITEASNLEMPLFWNLYFTENYQIEIVPFAAASENIRFNVSHILVVGKNHLPDDSIFDAVYPVLRQLFPKAKIGSGVNAYFAELNRNRPNSEKAEFINFTVSPQVHAFDNASLVENLEGQQFAVDSAKILFPEKPVYVSPVTLKQRFNVVGTSEEPKAIPGEIPSQVDVRQNTLFAAQWLLGSLKFLIQSEADLVTFFETAGWRGFIQGDSNPPVQDKFSARKGDIFPIYHLLKEFVGFEEVVFSESNKPLDIDGIVLSNKSKMKAIIANFSVEPQMIHIFGMKFKTARNFLNNEIIEIKKGRIKIPASVILILE